MPGLQPGPVQGSTAFTGLPPLLRQHGWTWSKGGGGLGTREPSPLSASVLLYSALPVQPPTVSLPSPPFLLSQNSPAPSGCWALQGLCLIPMIEKGRGGGRGAAAVPCCDPAAAHITVPRPCSIRPAPLLPALKCPTSPHPRLAAPPPYSACTGGLRASPSARAALRRAAPRDQRTGITVTVMYNK